MNAKDAKAVLAAAIILRTDADAIYACHTIGDEWDPQEMEALREYRLLRRLAGQLERISAKLD